jgi:site-specific DNA-methyltransferase (adenine-specific)
MPTIEDKSVDMILADLPYGVTACKWDTPLPLGELWKEWWRVCKGLVVLTAAQPFATTLISSNSDTFRYDLVWDKRRVSGFLNAQRAPLRAHENVLVFTQKQPTYNPQKTKEARKAHQRNFKSGNNKQECYGTRSTVNESSPELRFPTSVIRINALVNNSTERQVGQHPTQKPVALFEYLIRTYTNEGDTVLDPTCGSGTTAVACKRSNRHYICIEKEAEYCKIAERRVKEML